MSLYRKLAHLLLGPSEPDFGQAGDPVLDGYDIVILPDGVAPQFSGAWRLGVIASTSQVFTPGPAGTHYTAWIRARQGARASEPAASVLRLASDGTSLKARPNNPSLRSLIAIAGGDVHAFWDHTDVDGSAAAASFKLFGDGGGGQVDWVTPLVTVDAASRRATLTGLTPGVIHLIGIQAFSGGGIGDGNRAAMMVVPRSDAPPGLDVLSAVQVAF